MAVNDDEYAAAIDDYRKNHPNDASADLLSIDGDIMKKRYPEALASVDRLDKSVGGDPHLDLTRAGIQIEAKNYDEARALAHKLIEAEPDNSNGHWTLVNLSLKTGKYDDTLAELRILKNEYHLTFQDMSKVPEYSGFVKSRQYQEWLKEQTPKKPVYEAERPRRRRPQRRRRRRDGGGRFLLREAMERPQTEDEVAAVEADDLTTGEEVGQDLERLVVGRIVEHRDEHQAVGDVEVGVAGRQTLALEDHRLGHRQLDHTHGDAVLDAGRLETLPVLAAGGS